MLGAASADPAVQVEGVVNDVNAIMALLTGIGKQYPEVNQDVETLKQGVMMLVEQVAAVSRGPEGSQGPRILG